MAKPVGSSSIYLLPGMKAKFEMEGYIIDEGTKRLETGEDRELIRGFAVKDTDTGDIVATEEQEVAVIYTHKKFGANKVYFYALGQQALTSVIDIISVPIHDHSSIVAGGPAYGTYFTDDETST